MNEIDLPSVISVDLNKYVGIWYEIAKLPNSFEDDLKCITTNYSLRQDGNISVENKGFKDSHPRKLKVNYGKAWIPNPAYPGRLKVEFLWPFSTDYYILELDEKYQYALIGATSRKYLWILCRNPQMDAIIYNHLISKAKTLGFDISMLKKTKQDCMPD